MSDALFTLWRWSRKNSAWEFETQITDPEIKRTALRNVRRRNPSGTIFRWKEGSEPPSRRPFKRAVK